MKIYFFKGKSIISKIITLVTGGPHTHVGIELNGYFYEAGYISNFLKGRVLKSLHRCTYQSSGLVEYDSIEIKGDYSSEWLESKVGIPYDYKGLIGYVYKKYKQDPEKYYCSELVYEFLVKEGLLDLGEKYPSPNHLYNLMNSKYGSMNS